MCPYEGEKRTTDLGDCTDDKRLAAFKLLTRNELGRGFIRIIAEREISVKLHDGQVNCGGRSADGCSDLTGGTITLNGKDGAADLAGSVVHETQHFINYSNVLHAPPNTISPGSFATDEIHAYAAGLLFMSTLPRSIRARARGGIWADAYIRDPRGTLRQICSANGYPDCP